jgi:autotransporter-associated beta strand protein
VTVGLTSIAIDNSRTYTANYNTVAGGTTILIYDKVATFSGSISGTDPLIFKGSGGRIILTGISTYTGPTTIDTGAKLSVNGSIASSSSLTVYPDATIGGNGLLPNTIIQSGAILAPGNSIGQLTAPSLNFSGTLGAEFQGPQNDKTTVTGSVTNFTGTANLSPYGGGNPWPNFDYQLITAANNFTTSSSLTLTPVGITSALLLQGTTPVQEVDGNAKTFDVMWRPNNGSGATASAMAALGQGNRNQLAASGVFDSAFRRLASAAGDASGLTTGLNATGTAIGTTGFTTGQAAAAGLSPEFLSTTAQLLGISSNSQLSAAISTITPESYAAFQSVGLETLQRQRQQLLASAGQCASTGWVINGPTSKTTKAPKNPICLYGQAANANSSITGQDGLSSYNANLFSSFYGL